MGQLTPQEELEARRSWFFVDGTGSITTVPHYGFQPTEATVIAEWKTYDSQGNEYNMIDRFGISAKSIDDKDVALIVPPQMRTANKHVFALTSGAGNLLRKV